MAALKEFENAVIAAQKTRERRAAQERQATALRSALRLTERRYQGAGRYRDVPTSGN